MIKPIVLLLVCASCLSLLNQSNGEYQLANPFKRMLCPSFYFHCFGKQDGVEKMYASICVPFTLTHKGCRVAMRYRQIVKKCEQQKPKNSTLVFSIFGQSSIKCKTFFRPRRCRVSSSHFDQSEYWTGSYELHTKRIGFWRLGIWEFLIKRVSDILGWNFKYLNVVNILMNKFAMLTSHLDSSLSNSPSIRNFDWKELKLLTTAPSQKTNHIGS